MGYQMMVHTIYLRIFLVLRVSNLRAMVTLVCMWIVMESANRANPIILVTKME